MRTSAEITVELKCLESSPIPTGETYEEKRKRLQKIVDLYFERRRAKGRESNQPLTGI